MAASTTASSSFGRESCRARAEIRGQKLQDPLINVAARLLVVDAVTLAAQRQEIELLVILLQRGLHALCLFEIGAPVHLAVYQQYGDLDVLRAVDRRLRTKPRDIGADRAFQVGLAPVRVGNVA